MTHRLLTHLWAGIGLEALIVIAAYLLYNGLRVVVEGGQAEAVEHALRLVSIERALGLFHEESVQRAVDGVPWLAAFMRWFYLWAYLPILGVAGIIMYLRDRALYRRYRNAMFASAAVGLVIFAFVPVAPPRMLPEFGFFDSIHQTLVAPKAEKNDFAAVPSFHFGFTLLAAVGVAHAFRFRGWICALLAPVPVVMLISIVATANHFFVDAAVGAAIVSGFWVVLVRPDNGARRAAESAAFQRLTAANP